MRSFLMSIDMAIAVVLLLRLAGAFLSSKRGTNVFTRFVREGFSYKTYSSVRLFGIGATALFFLIGAIFKAPYVAFPTVIPVVLSFVLANKQNNSAQRIEDARVMTKTSLEVTGQVAGTVGTVAGTAMGNPALGKAIGNATGQIADKAASNMTDVQSAGIKICNQEEFLATAERAGIAINGRTAEQVCADVIKFAPTTALAALPDNMPAEEKAKRIMSGAFK